MAGDNVEQVFVQGNGSSKHAARADHTHVSAELTTGLDGAGATLNNVGVSTGPLTGLQDGWVAITLPDGSTGWLPVWK